MFLGPRLNRKRASQKEIQQKKKTDKRQEQSQQMNRSRGDGKKSVQLDVHQALCSPRRVIAEAPQHSGCPQALGGGRGAITNCRQEGPRGACSSL